MISTSKNRSVLVVVLITITFVSLTVALALGFSNFRKMGIPAEAGEFHSYLAFCEVNNPYGPGSVVIKTENGRGVIDTSRTDWWASDSDPPIYEGYTTLEINEVDYERTMRNPARYDTAWLYGPVNDFDKWADNDWSLTGCNIDVDCQNTGVPNIDSSFLRFYPADSQGNPSDDFGHTPIEISDVDDNGNVRTLIVHFGWVVAQYDFIINADLDLLTRGIGGNTVDIASAETYGYYIDKGSYKDFRGAKLDFSICYMVEITELKLEDEWTLNPTWIGLGNGICELTKIGFTDFVDTAESLWRDSGSDNNIEAQKDGQVLRYATREEALENNNPIPPLGETEVNLKTQAPERSYFRLDYKARLGYHWEFTTIGNTKASKDSPIFQELEFTQKVLIKFFTSEAKPLGPQGNDPLTLTRITTTTSDDDDWPLDSNWLLDFLRKTWNYIKDKWWFWLLAIGTPIVIIVIAVGPAVLLLPFKFIIGLIKGLLALRG